MSLIPWDVEDLTMYLFSICLLSLVKCLFASFAHFKIGLLSPLNFAWSLYILDISPLLGGCMICKHFFSCVYILFSFFLFLFFI